MQQSEAAAAIPPRPAHAGPDWVWCTCGINCIPGEWVAPSTRYRHRKDVREQELAMQENRPVMSHGRGLRKEAKRRKLQQDQSHLREPVPEQPVASSSRARQLQYGGDGGHENAMDIDVEYDTGSPGHNTASGVDLDEHFIDERNDPSGARDDEAVDPNIQRAQSVHRDAPGQIPSEEDLEELARLRALHFGDLDDEEEDVDPDRTAMGNASTSAAGEADPPRSISLEELQLSQDFIDALREATLDQGGLPEHVLQRLREPLTENIQLDDDPKLAFSLEYWLRLDNAAEAMYDSVRDLAKNHFKIDLLTLDQVKRRAEEITGVVPVYSDMCIGGCVAYTGPLAHREKCPLCRENRYQLKKKKLAPRKQSVTIPVGPQIQAAYRSKQSASEMKYRARLTQKMLDDIANQTEITLPSYADFIHSAQYIEALEEGHITDGTVMLMFSIDGAQLYRMKESDCWIYIWVILDRAPDNRYKNKHIMVGGIVPGPKKPKNIESFLFPGFHHAAALMKEGFRVWDADTGEIFDAKIFIPFFLGDGPGITILNGFVGHHGKYGCRLYCPMPGRHKPGAGGHYYPAMNCPHDIGEVHRPSQHPDVDILSEDFDDTTTARVKRYTENVETVTYSRTQAAYDRERRETGIVKPSLVSGFPPDSVYPIPTCFPGDIMHHAGLQTPDLFISLWRGTIQCSPGDNKDTWDWAVFRDETLWKAHGDIVAAARPYLPSSFDRPPRNIAEKLTSGYKAVEFITYLYGLGPGILLGVLPMQYWKNICKMIQGVRLLCQHSKQGIPDADLKEAYKLLLEFVFEFEDMYYQRKVSRLHFCRQSIHNFVHLATETENTGPPPITSQWPIERTIGILGGQIRQPSKPFANLAQRAIRRCQVNALKHMYPDIDPDSYKPGPNSTQLPRGTEELGDGFALLHFADKNYVRLPRDQELIIQDLVAQSEIAMRPEWLAKPTVRRWGRLRLPSGDVARGWREHEKPSDHVRFSQMIKYTENGKMKLAEAVFYFALHAAIDPEDRRTAFAMVVPWSPPDEELLAWSSGALWSCPPLDHGNKVLIPVKCIEAVVGMMPHSVDIIRDLVLRERLRGRWFMVPNLGASMFSMAGALDEDDEDDEDDDED